MNITDTVDMMMEVVNMAPDSLAVKESVIHCLGDLASVSTSAANAIADPKCVQLVLTAAKDTSSDVFAVESSGAEQASAQSLMTTAKAVRGFVWTVWVVWAVWEYLNRACVISVYDLVCNLFGFTWLISFITTFLHFFKLDNKKN